MGDPRCTRGSIRRAPACRDGRRAVHARAEVNRSTGRHSQSGARSTRATLRGPAHWQRRRSANRQRRVPVDDTCRAEAPAHAERNRRHHRPIGASAPAVRRSRTAACQLRSRTADGIVIYRCARRRTGPRFPRAKSASRRHDRANSLPDSGTCHAVRRHRGGESRDTAESAASAASLCRPRRRQRANET